jgi:sugar lactone lactonase YvrE
MTGARNPGGCLHWLSTMLACLVSTHAFAASDVTIDDKDVYPESITALADGTVIAGSYDKPIIYRAGPGKHVAEPWIHLSGQGSVSTLGVLADPVSHTLWACQSEKDPSATPPSQHTLLRSFDLKSGKDKQSYPLPGEKNLCNDIAIATDGTVYASDTINGQVLRLKPHGSLEVWLKDPTLMGVDGITFVNGVLFVSSVIQSTVLRIPVGADGSAETPVHITLSQPLSRPDGLRAQAGRLFVAENGAGRVSELKLDGDAASVVLIKDGYITPTAVQPVGKVLWVGDAKFAFKHDPKLPFTDAKLQGQDPNPFVVYALPLPN